MTETFPSHDGDQPHLIIDATYKDPISRALYIHRDLTQVQEPWTEEAHISPMKVTERFGDVEGWAFYLKAFDGAVSLDPFATWNARGLRAVLDYAHLDGQPGRCQWLAECPFVTSRQWNAWMALCNGQALSQRAAIEKLEDLAEDIQTPTPADLMSILRSLRASVNAKADTELRPDGTTSVAFSKDQTVKGGGAEGSVDLPSTFAIGIPALKGQVDGEGKVVFFKLLVRLRVAVDDNAHLGFRFTIPTAEQAKEDAYAIQVAAAKKLLGDAFTLLRAAD